jgi:hypothetical protein
MCTHTHTHTYIHTYMLAAAIVEDPVYAKIFDLTDDTDFPPAVPVIGAYNLFATIYIYIHTYIHVYIYIYIYIHIFMSVYAYRYNIYSIWAYNAYVLYT